MRFLFAILAYLAMAVVLGLGILQAVQGKPALLLISAALYVLALGALGCLPKKSH